MPSKLRLIDTDWRQTFDEAVSKEHRELAIISPFIQRRVVDRLLRHGRPESLRVITRFCLSDFCQGVSSTAALRVLLQHGAIIRGVKNLHAKVYIFGNERAIVTSANLTDAALNTNHEVGFVADDSQTVRDCRESFEKLWSRAGTDLTVERLNGWENEINRALAEGLVVAPPLFLRDEGSDLGPAMPVAGSQLLVTDAERAFVKFWGESTNRALSDLPILEEIKRSGCHWACTYPKGKRPRQVKAGDVMYMGRLVRDPNDTLIFGRAIAAGPVAGRDDATTQDIELRPWKAQWPHYAHVSHGEFLEGTIANGVSLGEMMNALGSDSFASTQRNAQKGRGNKVPRNAYRQQPAVLLSPQGRQWIEERIQAAFNAHGMISSSELARLDWPDGKTSTARISGKAPVSV